MLCNVVLHDAHLHSRLIVIMNGVSKMISKLYLREKHSFKCFICGLLNLLANAFYIYKIMNLLILIVHLVLLVLLVLSILLIHVQGVPRNMTVCRTT